MYIVALAARARERGKAAAGLARERGQKTGVFDLLHQIHSPFNIIL
jgi:hypothetical protein